MVMVLLVGYPLANLLLLVGSILVFARKTAGGVLLAIGAFVAFGLMVAWLIMALIGAWVHPSYIFENWRGWVMIIVGVLALATLILAMVPPTWRYLRSKRGFPPPAYGGYPGY
jgi:hypothetical protein